MAALVLLAACALSGGDSAGHATDAPRSATARVATSSGVTIALPRGFCVDPDASRDEAGQDALIVLSSCRRLRPGLFVPRPNHPAVLTTAITGSELPPDSGRLGHELADLLQSEHGRALLSRAGQADTVRISRSFVEGETLFLRLADTAPFAWGAVQPEYWRAILPLGGRMVSAAVLGPVDPPLAPQDGLDLLRRLVAGLRAENGSRMARRFAGSALRPRPRPRAG